MQSESEKWSQNWIYELNEGFMGWNTPGVGLLFSPKFTRQASRVEKTRFVMETEYRIDKIQNNYNVVNNDST